MGIFLEEVVLDLPGVVVAQSVGQLELGERILVEPVLVAVLPGARQLQLVEDAELHALVPPVIRKACAQKALLKIGTRPAVSLFKTSCQAPSRPQSARLANGRAASSRRETLLYPRSCVDRGCQRPPFPAIRCWCAVPSTRQSADGKLRR